MVRTQYSFVAVLAVVSGLTSLAFGSGCGKSADMKRREAALSAQATAAAEEIASEATLTSASSAVVDSSPRATEGGEAEVRAKGETVAAFRLEQSDFRVRLRDALDSLDRDLAHARRTTPPATRQNDTNLRDLRAKRALLKTDLDAVERTTEPDWATLRTKLERDLRDLRDLGGKR